MMGGKNDSVLRYHVFFHVSRKRYVENILIECAMLVLPRSNNRVGRLTREGKRIS